MEIVIYFLKENKHHIKCLYACTQMHVMYICAGDMDRRSCRVQNTEQRGQYEYERGTGMFILLCRAQKERMCNHTYTHPGTNSLKSQWNNTSLDVPIPSISCSSLKPQRITGCATVCVNVRLCLLQRASKRQRRMR